MTVPTPQPVPVTRAATSTLSEYTVTHAFMTTLRFPVVQLQNADVHSVKRFNLFLFAEIVRSFVEQSFPVWVASHVIGPTADVEASTSAPVALADDWFLMSPVTDPEDQTG